jgi:hypothetical protein
VDGECVVATNPVTSNCNLETEIPCGSTCCPLYGNMVCSPDGQCITIGAGGAQLEVAPCPTDTHQGRRQRLPRGRPNPLARPRLRLLTVRKRRHPTRHRVGSHALTLRHVSRRSDTTAPLSRGRSGPEGKSLQGRQTASCWSNERSYGGAIRPWPP